MKYDTLQVSVQGEHTLVVTLNRPAASNAMNTQMGMDLMNLFEGLLLDTQALRCVVIGATGDKAFCAGGDLKERHGMTDVQWQAQHAVFERMLRALMQCPLPVIAAVNGAAYGGGCELAAACDFIYAARGARFALTETRLGIMPGTGGTQNLPRAIGERRAKELIFSARPFDAVDAKRWGLVNEVFELDDLMPRTMQVARDISANGPIGVRQAKQSIQRGLQMSVWDGLAYEIEAYNRMIPTEDRREGVLAFNEKRLPRFKGR